MILGTIILVTLGAVAEGRVSFLLTPVALNQNIREQQQHYRTKREEVPPVNIYSLHIESHIRYRYTHTLVHSRVANTANISQEVHFSMVLPETAFIRGFTMEVGGRTYKAYVKEKQEAKKQYDQAVESGIAAGHVAVSTRDSNHFTVSLNVEPRSKINFNLNYEELLSRTLGVYSHVINLNPGQVVSDLQVNVYISESQPLSKIIVPELRSGNEVNPEHDKKQNALAKIIRRTNKRAHIIFSPSPEQQKVMSKEGEEGIAGQFVVEYDVENQKPGGEILVNEGYFVHFLAPNNLPTLRKQAIFVLDVSGSMAGRKLEQLKQAMHQILDDLSPEDYFNIIEFSYSVTVWNLDELSSSAVFQPELPADGFWWYNKAELSTTVPPSTTLMPQSLNVPSFPATEEYVRKAKEVINKMTSGGGTNIHGALKTALLAAHDGLKNLEANSTSNETTVKDSKVAPEPIIIFLTDGDATVGVTKPSKILSTVQNLNEKRYAIFSLAFGEGADLSFVRRLSLANNGFARNIYEASDAALQLKNFYNQVASPLLSNVTFNYIPGQVINSTLTTHNFHTLFLGSQLVVAGKVEKSQEVEGQVTGLTATGPAVYDLKSVRDVPDIIDEVSTEQNDHSAEEVASNEDESKADKEAKRKKNKATSTLERLWAYLTIKQLLDQIHVLDDKDVEEEKNTKEDPRRTEIKQKALELALLYSFVTPLTSLVVVKPNKTTEVNTEQLRPHQLMQDRYYARPRPLLGPPQSGTLEISGFQAAPPQNSINRVDTVDKWSDKTEHLTLSDIFWSNELIDTENATVTLPLGVNGIKQQYRLGINETDTEFQECLSAMVNPSHCRHLPHCVLSEVITNVTNYIRFFCPIPGGFAGICCPDEIIDLETTTLPLETTTTEFVSS